MLEYFSLWPSLALSVWLHLLQSRSQQQSSQVKEQLPEHELLVFTGPIDAYFASQVSGVLVLDFLFNILFSCLFFQKMAFKLEFGIWILFHMRISDSVSVYNAHKSKTN